MKIKTAIITILVCILLPILNIYAQESVTVSGRIDVDLYSTVSLSPVTVEISQPSVVTIRAVTSDGTPLVGRNILIVSPNLNIVQPSTVTDSQGYTTGQVSISTTGTYTVCAKDVTYGYDINIQNCKTLYVIPVSPPDMVAEPYYTKGESNLVFWDNLGSGYKYTVEVSLDSTFDSVIGSSGWIPHTSYLFTGLEDSRMYFYRVRTQNPYGGISSWSSAVFSVQDSKPPVVDELTIGGVGNNTTQSWDPNSVVKMVFRVTDNLQLESATFLCVDSASSAYSCTSDYKLEGNNLTVNLRLGDLEKNKDGSLRGRYEFCIETIDTAGNITRRCGIYVLIPITSEIEPPIPPTPPIPPVTPPAPPPPPSTTPSTTGNIVDTITDTVKIINEVLDNTVGRLDPVTLERVVTTASVVTISTAVAMSVGSLLNLPYFLLQLVLNILSWLGLRAGGKPLGYVYDAITKEPIFQAIVRIFDESGKIVWSDVTNSRGFFSGRLEEGKYKIVVSASEYTFPSTIVYGKDDFPLTNIYHGGEFHISKEEEINFSIPLDPADVSEFKVWLEILWGRVKGVVGILHVLLFLIGLVLAVYMFYRDPYWLTVLVLMLYVPSFFFILRSILKRDRYGYVKDVNGKAVEGLVIGLREAEYSRVVVKRVTDRHGRYRMFVDRGEYYLEVLDGSFEVESIKMGNKVNIKKDSDWVARDIVVSKVEEK